MKIVILKVFVLTAFLAFGAGSVFAFDGGFIDLGAEANGNASTGIAVARNASLGLEISSNWAIGMKTAYSYAEAANTLEPSVFIRWYRFIGTSVFYAQTELGTAIIFEDIYNSFTYMGGLAAGFRIPMGLGMYIAPVVRIGYPFIWGAGLKFGFAFNNRVAAASDDSENREIINR